MRSNDIRTTFTDFFTARGHKSVPSSPLIPADPTLLLTNAGMNQFKPYFLGETAPPFPRATSIQKCARTSDIENVGRTNRHATFFEMLGNFSFGDYFKADAIAFAWELLTEHYNLDRELLWITVFQDDDEAETLWRRVGVPASRIQRLGMVENYWSMTVPGPCGPCSEVHYDRGPGFGREGGPAVDGERYVEIWNLVFMQSMRGEGDSKGNFPILGDLDSQSIDTGLGLDRLAAILQDVPNVCSTDLLAPTLNAVQDLAGRPYPGADAEEKVSFQVVTEHARSIAFLIADGVMPAKDGRGYILRRLMRRAIHHGRKLGITGPILPAATASVIANLAGVWPELSKQDALIAKVVAAEEEGFGRTLAQGSRLLTTAITSARDTSTSVLSGETAFELHDTYGFPIELTVESAREAGLKVDADRFAELLAEQQRRGKTGGKAKTTAALARLEAYRKLSAQHGRTRFIGYDRLMGEATILGIIEDGQVVAGAQQDSIVEVVLDRTPFYAEGGGQVGDIGTIRTADGVTLHVTDTRAGLAGFTVHTARISGGDVLAGEPVLAAVDAPHRAAVARSHSATHVLHAMLHRSLGSHANQQGSLVQPGRLRFDFAHFSPLTSDALHVIERMVNEYLLDDPEVRVWEATQDEAMAAGAMSLFGEKYGDIVRIVDIGDASRELCGGTHVGHGSNAGPIRILGESSIGSNLRRIEALTGRDALDYLDSDRALLAEVSALLEAKPKDAPAALRKRLAMLSDAQGTLTAMRDAELATLSGQLAAEANRDGGAVVAQRVSGVGPDELRRLAADTVAGLHVEHAAVILGMESDGKVLLVAAVSPALLGAGIHAAKLIARAAKAVGGGGGGTGAVAQAGGRVVTELSSALSLARTDAAEAIRELHR